MNTVKPIDVPTKRLATSITAASTSFQLSDILDWAGNALTSASFGQTAYGCFRDTNGTVLELFSFDPTTIASGSITFVTRGFAFDGSRTTSVPANVLSWVKGTTLVELGSDFPMLFQYLKDYIDNIALVGAPVMTNLTDGVARLATAAANPSDPIVVGDNDARLPTAAGVVFLAATTGMVIPFIGNAAPSGFLLCDGSSYTTTAQPGLAVASKGLFGLGSLVTFTAAANVITATSHGLSAGTIIMVQTTNTLPAGLTVNTPYYVISPTTNTFQVSLTSGGSAVTISTGGTGTQSYSSSFKVPDLRGRHIIGAGSAATKVATIASIAGNIFTVTGLTNANNNEFQTGQPVVFAAGTAGNLVNGTTYYVVRVTNTTFSLAASAANAQLATPAVITLLGTEAGTFTLTMTARTAGDTGGNENLAEIIAHNHPGLPEDGNKVLSGSGSHAADYQATTTSGNAGANPLVSVMNPFVAMTYIVKT